MQNRGTHHSPNYQLVPGFIILLAGVVVLRANYSISPQKSIHINDNNVKFHGTSQCRTLVNYCKCLLPYYNTLTTLRLGVGNRKFIDPSDTVQKFKKLKNVS